MIIVPRKKIRFVVNRSSGGVTGCAIHAAYKVPKR